MRCDACLFMTHMDNGTRPAKLFHSRSLFVRVNGLACLADATRLASIDFVRCFFGGELVDWIVEVAVRLGARLGRLVGRVRRVAVAEAAGHAPPWTRLAHDVRDGHGRGLGLGREEVGVDESVEEHGRHDGDHGEADDCRAVRHYWHH